MRTHHRPRRVNWRPYLERRVLIVVALTAAGYFVEHITHVYMIGKGAEMCLGAVVGHVLLEVEG